MSGPQPTYEYLPVPLSLKIAIEISQELLESHRKELSDRITTANNEIMGLIGISHHEGWKLNIESMQYERPIPEKPEA